jgi:lipoprotein signal peptidase
VIASEGRGAQATALGRTTTTKEAPVTTRQPTPPAARRRRLALAAGVILVDQATKLAAELLSSGHRHGLLVPVRNPRFSLGLAAATRPLMLLAMATGIALVAAYGVRAAGRRALPGWIPALVVGGALSNLLDRLVLGAVRDFLAIAHIVINLADLAVLAGVIGYCLTRLIRQPATRPAPASKVHP